jgi:hypothetical protein
MRFQIPRSAFRLWVALGLFLFVPVSSAAQTPVPSAERYLVVPFENPTREARIYWIGEAAAVLLADNLNAFG